MFKEDDGKMEIIKSEKRNLKNQKETSKNYFVMREGILIILLIFIILYLTNLFASSINDDKLQWWREARFGMFIHWGIYSVLGGEWKGKDYGKEMGGPSAEWIMRSAKIPIEEYKLLAKEFNPVNFNPKEWVGLAKEAGMKYIVITAKHHDGFCLFDSKYTDFDVIDATSFKRDIIKELSEECKRQGIRFGVYYSHNFDWTHRPTMTKEAYYNLVRGQLRELLTNYGKISIMWFDMGNKKEKEVNDSYAEIVKELQPDCLISGRLRGTPGMNDYSQQGDRRIPSGNVKGDAETPMTMRDNWGFDKDEKNWKSTKELLERLVLSVSRGANFLLNVGPKPDGTFCPEEVERLKSIGEWMKINSEAIYGTQMSPFDYDFPWGTITRKNREKKIYLHILKWNPEGIFFDNFKTKIKKAYILAAPSMLLKFDQDLEKGTVRIKIPQQNPGKYITVIALELEGEINIIPEKRPYFWHKGTGIKLDKNANKKDKRKIILDRQKLQRAQKEAYEFWKKLGY